ncbi:MAG: TldD/PmbA family protein [Methanomicrobiales archaeon]|jgi:TldD protein|nr:TldD/PmbA family protein [Methanomicrobiales archaeon]
MDNTAYRYYDVRRVRGEATHIDIDNTRIELAGSVFYDTALIRVLGEFGWGVLSLDGEMVGDIATREKLPLELIQKALHAAKLTNERIEISETASGMRAIPAMKEDPRASSLEEKAETLLDIEKHAKKDEIVSTRLGYIEKTEQISFASSHGDEYEYELVRSGFSVMAVSRRGSLSQMGYNREHTISGIQLRTKHHLAAEAADRAVKLLDAKPAKGGKMKAILDPELAGVFAHEAVGHAAEGDLVKEGSSVLENYIGKKIGPKELTVIDDPTLEQFGFCPVDDEGTKTECTEIISHGVMHAYLHSKETLAADIGYGIAGHSRGMPGDVPIVRMSNTFIAPGECSYDELIESCRDGILLIGSRGGQVDPGRGIFQFNAEYGYLIENGEVGQMVRDVSLSGEILTTLHAITHIGDDLTFSAGFCGKSGQSVPVSDGSPHILLSDAIVGGSDV